jgi:hypothetical protein
MDIYERLGWLKRDSSTGYCWIVNYTKHQSKNEQWRAAAHEQAAKLVGTTILAQEWLDYYAGIKPKSALKSGLKSAEKAAPSLQTLQTEHNITDTPADAASESKTALRSAEFKPLFAKLAALIDQGERELAIKHPAKQNEAKACRTLRLIVDTDSISEEELLRVARWCFVTGNNTRFYLDNLAVIDCWRKFWKNAGCKAILDACRKYASAHVDQSKPYYTPPREDTDFTGGDGEPGPGSIFGDPTDEERCELERERQVAAAKEREHV